MQNKIKKCLLCEEEKELHPFYWGFFNAIYDEDKWINVCEECRNHFLKLDKDDIWLMYREIESKLNNDEKQLQRIRKIQNQRRY